MTGMTGVTGSGKTREPGRPPFTHSITHNFIYPTQVYDLTTETSDDVG